MTDSDAFNFAYPMVPHACLVDLDHMRNGKAERIMDNAVELLRYRSHVTPEEAHPKVKQVHDKAVASGCAPYDWAEHLLKWPKVSADRVKMRIVGQGQDRQAVFYISYDS